MTDTIARGAGLAERAHHAGGDGLAPEQHRRMSAKRKQSAVFRLLRGEDLALVSQGAGSDSGGADHSRSACLAAGEASLKNSTADGRDVGSRPVQGQGRDLTMADELGATKVEQPGGRPPFAPVEVEAMQPPGLALRAPDLPASCGSTRVSGHVTGRTVSSSPLRRTEACGVGRVRAGRCPTWRSSRQSAAAGR